MARKSAADPEKNQSKAEDQAKGDVQEQVDAENEQGFVGTKVDPIPNEAYSLESGPESPDVVEQRAAAREAETTEAE